MNPVTGVSDSYEDIQKCLRCTREKCNNCLTLMKRSAVALDANQEAMMKKVDKLIKKGLTGKEIMKKLDITMHALRSYRARLGYERKNGIIGSDPDKFWELYNNKASDREIAAAFKCSYETVRDYRKKNGIPAWDRRMKNEPVV